MEDDARAWADIARHVIGCYETQETRGHKALDICLALNSGAPAILHGVQALPADYHLRGERGRLQKVGGVGALAAAAAGAGRGEVQPVGSHRTPVPSATPGPWQGGY